jgi:hypothetical protein
MWWRSEMNRSFFLCLAICRMRSSACDTLSWFCARRVALPGHLSALFSDFPATTVKSDLTSRVRASSAMSPRLHGCGRSRFAAVGQTRDFPSLDQSWNLAHGRFCSGEFDAPSCMIDAVPGACSQ